MIGDLRQSDSPFVEKIWSTSSDSAGSFISQASSHWEIVITHLLGKATLTVRGPETRASPVDIPADAEWLGITFKLGAFMPDLPPAALLDGRDVYLPEANATSVWLQGAAWELPNFENADDFVSKLAREGLLKHDPIVDVVLQGDQPALSPRALQYRFLRATGLTQNKLHQIERASQAAALLAGGMPISAAAYEAGYFDQAHLTNALKRFIGQTPGQIARGLATE